MAIFNKIDFSKAHDTVICYILDYLIQGVQQSGQKVSYKSDRIYKHDLVCMYMLLILQIS